MTSARFSRKTIRIINSKIKINDIFEFNKIKTC